MLNVSFTTDIVCDRVCFSTDEDIVDKPSHHGLVRFSFVEIRQFCRAVELCAPTWIWRRDRAQIVPMLYDEAVFKPEHVKPGFRAKEIILGVSDDIVAVREHAFDIRAEALGRRVLHNGTKPRQAIGDIQIVLNILFRIDVGDGRRVPGVKAVQQRGDFICLT